MNLAQLSMGQHNPGFREPFNQPKHPLMQHTPKQPHTSQGGFGGGFRGGQGLAALLARFPMVARQYGPFGG